LIWLLMLATRDYLKSPESTVKASSREG